MRKLALLMVLVGMLLVACQNSDIYITEISKDNKLVTDQAIMEQVMALDESYQTDDLKVLVFEYEIESYKLYLLTSQSTRLNDLILYGDEVLTFQLSYLDKLYELDANGDGYKELFFINDIGSGVRLPSGVHIDFKDMSVTTNIMKHPDNKIHHDGMAFKAVNGKIMVYPYYYEFDKIGQEAIGQLIIDESITVK